MLSSHTLAMTYSTEALADIRRDIWVRFLLYPSHTLPTAAAPVLVAAGLALSDGVFAPVPLLLAFVGSWLIHLAGVLADNHELLRRHADVSEHPELLRALDVGALTLAELRRVILACIVLAVLAGTYPVWLGGVPAFVIGAVGVLASLGYAAGPRYARAGLADPLFLLMFGVVAVVGCYYVQIAAHGLAWTDVSPRAFVLGVPVGCVVTAALVIDDVRDRGFDADKGWRTTAVRFGLAGSRVEFVGLLAAAYLLPLCFWLGLDLSAWVLLPWLSAPVAVAIARAVRRFDTTRDLLPMTPLTSWLSLVFGALLGAGIALS